jgi:microcystin-dependent protein
MAEPFLSEIRIFSFGYAPRSWALCNGQLLPINQNQALFSLLGTTYGGNGQTNFALPDLRGKTPIHFGAGFVLGQTGGEQAHTITQSEMPQHVHILNGSSAAADAAVPGGNLMGVVDNTTFGNAYAAPSNLVAMNPLTVGNVGGSQPHPNMQPYIALNICIALQGIFPSRN